ncbi:hypothetical protein JCM10207_002509 [Rhodosporidiobolus poonsookiae]
MRCSVALALLASSLFLHPALARGAIERRQVEPLSFTWDTPDEVVYRSTDTYICRPYSFTVKGAAPPFLVDAVLASNTSAVLSHVTNLTAGSSVAWNVDLAVAERFLFRVTDSTGRTVYSNERQSRIPV